MDEEVGENCVVLWSGQAMCGNQGLRTLQRLAQHLILLLELHLSPTVLSARGGNHSELLLGSRRRTIIRRGKLDQTLGPIGEKRAADHQSREADGRGDPIE